MADCGHPCAPGTKYQTPVVEQQRDQQRRAAGIQIDRPSNRTAVS